MLVKSRLTQTPPLFKEEVDSPTWAEAKKGKHQQAARLTLGSAEREGRRLDLGHVPTGCGLRKLLQQHVVLAWGVADRAFLGPENLPGEARTWKKKKLPAAVSTSAKVQLKAAKAEKNWRRREKRRALKAAPVSCFCPINCDCFLGEVPGKKRSHLGVPGMCYHLLANF